jgi:DNA-binding NarL/FixJ family response regulator
MIQVAIVDDHQLYRKSMVLLLAMFQEIQVVFDTDDGAEFLEVAKHQYFDILILDLQMPKMNGFEVCEKIKETQPDLRVLIVSQLNTKEAIHQIMGCGANGFISKNATPEQLENALYKIYENDFYFDIALATVVQEALLWERKNQKDQKSAEEHPLTSREIEIVRMVAQELNSKEIAESLSISPRTVDTHRKAILEKTQSKNFVGVVLYAIRHEIIKMPLAN